MVTQIIQDFLSQANPEKAKHLQRFFKNSPGQYGENDLFLGITVPITRSMVKQKYLYLTIEDLQELITNKYHEIRSFAILVAVIFYQRKNLKKEIYDFYLNNTQYINNWDLVDLSCAQIVGNYLEDKDRSILYQLAKSPSMWERRIAIVSTNHFIKKGQFEDTFNIATILLNDKEDLLHKATGWMLREIDKKDHNALLDFLKDNVTKMPRTALRYAIEHFDTQERKYWMSIK